MLKRYCKYLDNVDRETFEPCFMIKHIGFNLSSNGSEPAFALTVTRFKCGIIENAKMQAE